VSDEAPAELTIRSLTITEVITGDGERRLAVQTEGEPELWDMLGMLDWVRHAIQLEGVALGDWEG
jgi:hypothetical protein